MEGHTVRNKVVSAHFLGQEYVIIPKGPYLDIFGLNTAC